MRLRLLTGFYIGHHPGCAGTWHGGEEREVPAETAAYLLDVQGHRFAACGGPVEPEAERADVAAPPADRVMRPAKPRGKAGA